MALRFPQREPRDAKELFQWLRELLPDLEAKVIENAVVETTETAIAHGLGTVPVFVHPDAPHCIAVVRQVQFADAKCVYLRATNRCVVNVLVVKSAQLARLTTSMRNGGFHLPDWDPTAGLPTEDRLVAADASDTVPGTLLAKTASEANVNRALATEGGVQVVKFGVAISSATPLSAVDGGDPGDASAGAKPASYSHRHPKEIVDPATDGARLHTAAIPPPASQNALAILAPQYRWADADVFGFGYLTLWDRYPYNSPWIQTSPGVWTFSFLGEMADVYTDGVTPFIGMRIAIPFDFQSATNEGNAAVGIYVVTNVGSATEYPQIARATDADSSVDFVQGKILHVTGGATWADHTFVYVTETLPTLGTTVLRFEDHGTSSIFASVTDGTMGFGTIWQPSAGVCTWSKVGEGVDGVAQPPSRTRFLVGATLPGAEVSAGARYLINEGSPYDGLYEVQTYGTYEQVIRRVDEVNEPAELTGVVVNIAGIGVWHAGDYFRQANTIATIDVSATDWAITSTNPLSPTDELLTGAQLTSEGASTDPITVYKMASSGDGPVNLWLFPPKTLVGTPGLSTLPAGRESCQIGSIYVEDWDRAANPGQVTVAFQLRNDTSETVLFTAPCGIPVSSTAQRLAWQYDFSPSATVAPTDRFSLNVVITSTTATQVKVVVRYNSAERDTWIQLAGVQFSLAGTTDHQRLDNRLTADVGNGNPPTHNADSIGPGFLHTPVATSAITAGLLPSPTRNNVIATGAELKWIGTTKMSAGDRVLVRFVDPLILRHGDESPPTGSASLWLNGSDMEDRDVDWLTSAEFGNCIAEFQLCTDDDITPSPCWRMLWNRTGELLT